MPASGMSSRTRSRAGKQHHAGVEPGSCM